MSNLAKIIVSLSSLFSMTVLANDATELQNRLNKINSFHANFEQRVTDAEHHLVQSGEGELSVKRPNLFNWHMKKPDESTIISDGKTIWFYNPFVEQVTASWLKDATNDTPFMLLARDQTNNWKDYRITQSGDHFVLTPVNTKSHIKQFTLDVTATGSIKKFTSIEQDGQKNSYLLTHLVSSQIDPSLFTFTPPVGVSLDDQRQ